MAKENNVTLGDLTKGLQANKLAMNPSILAQIEAAQASIPEATKESAAASVVPKSSKTDSLLASLNSNIVKLTKAIIDNTRVIDSKSKVLQGKSPTSPNDLSENDIENRKSVDAQTELLQKIEENTRPPKSKGEDDEKKPKLQVGGWLTAIALALGAAAGIFVGKLKAFMLAMKVFGGMVVGLAKFLKNLIPEAIRSAILNKFKAIKTFFIDLGTKIMINLEYALNIFTDFFKNRFAGFINRVQSVFKTVSEFISNVVKVLRGWGSKIVQLFVDLKTAIMSFFEPIREAWQIVKTYSSSVSKATGKVTGFFSSIGEFFTGLGSKLSIFRKLLGGVFKLFKNISYPITVIMGLFDGITGAIEGFKKDGLVGGIFGFIKGAWNSIVSSFMDLIKDMISWVLDKFGFKDAAKWLDSFSFEDIFNSFWDAFAKPFKAVQDFFTNLEIPKFDFSIFGKKFEFGPYKIAGGGDAKAKTATATVPTVVAPSAAASDKVYKQSAENKEADKKITHPKSNTVITAPTQVNNQTQNAVIKTPIRNNDNTINRYLAMNF